MTSSPGLIFSAIRQANNASVPEETPIPNAQFEYCAMALSHSCTHGPSMKFCDSTTCAMTLSMSPFIDRYCAFKSSNGTFMENCCFRELGGHGKRPY